MCDPESASGSRASSELYESESVQSDHLPATKVEYVHLEWQGLCCSYNTSHGKIDVLQDIWGAAIPGEMQVGAVGCASPQRSQLVGAAHAVQLNSGCADY